MLLIAFRYLYSLIFTVPSALYDIFFNLPYRQLLTLLSYFYASRRSSSPLQVPSSTSPRPN